MTCGVASAAPRRMPSTILFTILFIGGGEIPICAFPSACLAMHEYTDGSVGELGPGSIVMIIGDNNEVQDADRFRALREPGESQCFESTRGENRSKCACVSQSIASPAPGHIVFHVCDFALVGSVTVPANCRDLNLFVWTG
jgi:hypothetical protein